ncbi:uncharacterized protein LOC121760941 [Salvia splendens]|uniref:uncharacterized protein LOC121760941 n=1 Tax=Salvia splendens TaxID=180675 RepID=UPI001C252F77|nr:uncharacterized protein LOC121760941 [Salvia splendens]XP_042012471.1 uncharacterized protein LOC121760941 [Salvia splendens]
MWTDQKHSLFLQHLELSFVKQLHQSISLLDQDVEEKSTTLIDHINLAGRLHGCWKIKCNRGHPLSHVSVDSIGHSKRPTVSAHAPEPWKVVKPNCDLHDSQREGTGQNFVDENNQSNSDTEYRVKRTKTMLADK